jgi:formate dehydrogenase major subunit
MPQVIVNGQPHAAPTGTTILTALRALGFDVPTVCHDPRLTPYGGCRLCVVSVKGQSKPVTSCNAVVADGMEIATHTDELESLRRTLLKLLARDYPADQVDRFPDKQFHRYLKAYGVQATGKPQPAKLDLSHPYIHVDMSQCVTCYRCVRICDEVQGQFVWQAWNRGDQTEIRPATGVNLATSECVSCGACVDTCPSGALEDKSLLLHGVPTQWTKTICSYCGTGCEVNVGTRDNRITTIRPALEGPSNHGHTCVKGRYAFDYVYAKDRVTSPMIRRDGDWQKVGWDEAIAFVADRLRDTIARHGPDSIGLLTSARGTNEENYVGQKFARLALGTNNVDCCARVCHSPTAAAMKMTLGTGAATNSLDDIELAKTILVCGANPTDGHPVTGARIKQAVRRGANLIIVDPREIELNQFATIHLALRPGTNVIVFNAMAATIVEEGLVNESFVRERLTEYDEFREYIRQFIPEKVASVCGIPAETLRQAARLYATDGPSLSVHGLGMTEHIQGTEGIMALVNIALLTGNIGQPGTGINPLRGQNNVQGAPHMGCEPKLLAGYVPIDDARQKFEAAYRAPLPVTKGMNMMDMLDAAPAGKLKVLWAIGYDIMLTNPNAHETRRALEAVDLVIVQDLFLNQTAQEFGDVFLPAATSFEKDGTFMNGERRIQRIRKTVEPAGEALSDWEIVCAVARALGHGDGFAYKSAEEIWDEVRTLWDEAAGISYRRLDEQGGLQWPCYTEDDPGLGILHADRFSHGKTTPLRRIEYVPPPEITDDQYPFLLTTGRNLYQYNAATQTNRTANAGLHATDYLNVSSSDAHRLGLGDGETVRLRSRQGQAQLPVRISDTVKPGELYATFHSARVFLNEITSAQRDRYTKTPEYKVTAVRLEKMR